MSCIYRYKNKFYTEPQIKDLILEQDVLKNHPIITFTKKIFKTLPFQYKEDLLNEGSKKYGIERGESTATIKYSLADQNKVEYGLKAIEILHSDKAIQIFEKGKKANWDLNKILTELQIPKEQKQLILDLGITDREKIALELASKYSFVVEINTAKKEYSKNYTRGNQTPTEDRPYGNNTFEINNVEYSSNIMDGGYKKYENGKYYNITAEEYKKAFDSFEKTYETIPTSYYSNLTVHGGTNYTENEISTPLITPSIKGHAQFATDNGIGWFRSDDKLDNIKYELATSKHNTDEHRFSYGEFIKNKNSVRVTRNVEGDYSIHEGDLSDLSKSERIKLFEKQSSVIPVGGKIVQRGASSFDGIRHRINLKNHGFSIEYGTNNLQEYKSTDKNAVQEFSNAYNLGSVIEKDGKLFTKGVILTKNIDIKSSTKTRRILELQSDLFQKGRDKKNLVGLESSFNENNKDLDDFLGFSTKGSQTENQFLQLLNKDNNWVTFFVKSIIQDTAKQTITEVQQEDVEAKVRELEKEGLLEIDCKGKLKAEKGLTTSFTKGGTWKVIKDLKGYPTHKEGGVDLTIGKNGVTIKNGNTQFTAKHGLVIPKAQNGLVIPEKGKNDIDHWKNVYSKNKRLPQYVWDYYTPQEQINYFGTTKENNTSNIKGVTVFNNLLKNKTAYGNFLSGDADVAVNNKDYFEISNLYKSGKINRKEYLEKLYSKAVNTSDGSKYTHKGGSNPPIRPLNINSSQDALNIFLGKPQKYNSFSISDYKPSTSNNKNSYYYKLNREEELENELFNTSKNVLTNQDDFINSGENERFVKGSHLGEASLKNFKLSKGEDDRGKYVSYYDINDYGNVLDLAGNPFEIYNRIYYKNYDGQNKKMYYSDKELSTLNMDKKDFDILGLQRELSNRGYKLPKSTKQDGSLDGIWGDETKNALLEYRKSQNK